MKQSRLIAVWILSIFALAEFSVWAQPRPRPAPLPRTAPPRNTGTRAPNTKPAVQRPIGTNPAIRTGAAGGIRTSANGTPILVRGTTRAAPSSSVRSRPQATTANRGTQTGTNAMRQSRMAANQNVPPVSRPSAADQMQMRTRLTALRQQLASIGGGSGRGGGQRPPGGGSGGGAGSGSGGFKAANDNNPIFANRGSTVNPQKGSFHPRDLRERLAVEHVVSQPNNGTPVRMKDKMSDSRWPDSEGWVKMQQVVWPTPKDKGGAPVVVHYVMNSRTGKIDDVKIKGRREKAPQP